MLAKRDAKVDQALFVDVDQEEVIRRLSGRWICSKTPDHVYHAVAKPPKVAGKCDIDGAPLVQRDDDKPETIRARLSSSCRPCTKSLTTTRSTRCSAQSTPAGPSTKSLTR